MGVEHPGEDGETLRLEDSDRGQQKPGGEDEATKTWSHRRSASKRADTASARMKTVAPATMSHSGARARALTGYCFRTQCGALLQVAGSNSPGDRSTFVFQS